MSADGVEATLARYAALTRAAMEPYLLRDGTPSAYLYDLVAEYPLRPGKGIRPALLLATCQAFGGRVREGLGPAVALEMFHNAFLIHDDVQDASPTRRGLPTLHELHGMPLAVNAGDALAALALAPLRDEGPLGGRVARRVLDELQTMVRHTTEGQALELGWRRENAVELGAADYLTMTAKKTCWYTTVAPLRIGALVGSSAAAALGALSRFGFYLGLAFQIRDDLLNLVGRDGLPGKEPLSDLREGKRTLMLVHVLASAGGGEREWLTGYLGVPEEQRTDDEVARVRELMREHRSVEFAAAYGEGVERCALDAFDAAFAEADGPEHVDFVRALVPYMLARSA